jgi:hypothetical protein
LNELKLAAATAAAPVYGCERKAHKKAHRKASILCKSIEQEVFKQPKTLKALRKR